jgi:hypothetical protein
MGLFVGSFEDPSERKLHIVIAQGYLASFALFECLGLVVLFTTALGNFALLVGLYGVAAAALSVIGILRVRKTGGLAPSPVTGAWKALKKKEHMHPDPQALAFWILFAALLAFELFMSYTHASYDGGRRLLRGAVGADLADRGPCTTMSPTPASRRSWTGATRWR